MEGYVGYSHCSYGKDHRYVALGVREPKVAKAEVDETEVEALVKKAALIFDTAVPHDKTLSSSATVAELNIIDNGIEAIVNTEQTLSSVTRTLMMSLT